MSTAEYQVTTVEQLEAIYGTPKGASVAKEIDHIAPAYRRLIEASPFMAIATGDEHGFDCSPKGDAPGFVRVVDEKTLAIPDRPGNSRIDGFRNIIRNPHVALLFLIPGIGETLRVNGRASISIAPSLLQSFAVDSKLPRSVLVVNVDTVFFHCSRAIVRSKLWDEASKVDRRSLPSTGSTIAEVSAGKLGGEAYDRELPDRIKSSLY